MTQHPQYHSVNTAFEPICPHITKDECAKARSEMIQAGSSSICDRVHFRPLIRPHTDQSLGHCSYLNTCYSEPTYAQSPSIPPFPNANLPRPPGSVSLPNGLGAGGRGKEKAPCRYLHFEVDWDETDSEVHPKEVVKPRRYKLDIGLGPGGKDATLVSSPSRTVPHLFIELFRSYRLSGLTVTSVASTTPSLESSM